ncbi:sulfatase family protein [Sphingobium nicotianae]|uniref:Sulfatase n=1 Tax=Sphingobium nicotianae TaxID=2782607 RepID=A0A9X1DA09_9SPHN|nr:sulfatase [Sphingobium nicotianae]MBT2186095.1 sulfatase [Sphingobium nicotianae]
MSNAQTSRRRLLKSLLAGAVLPLAGPALARSVPKRVPNFIVVFCDDLGFGDIGANGADLVKTPNLDRMAAEGTVFTDFYASANLCTPSRAGLLTGRYPIRTGLAKGVIMQDEARGLPLSEVTIPEALKQTHKSALIGKWHLGHTAPYWPPTKHGFDYFYGLPYSHDMVPLSVYESSSPDAVKTVIEKPDIADLQQQFYGQAERFIRANAQRPFFLDLALSGPHLPSEPSADYKGRSAAGDYGDVVEEIDAIVGRLLALLRELKIENDTLVLFTSDNGPWFEGSAGDLRQRKGGGGYDGGYRVPMLAWQPGTVPAGRKSNAIGMSIDFLPTFCAMAGLPAPQGVTLDGLDISDMLTRGGATPHSELLLFNDEDVVAVRTQDWKYSVAAYYRGMLFGLEGRGYPQLYDMRVDRSERYSVASRHPDILAAMQARMGRARATFDPMRQGPTTIFAPWLKGGGAAPH